VAGNSETVPVVAGALALGTWQSVMLVELDGQGGSSERALDRRTVSTRLYELSSRR